MTGLVLEGGALRGLFTAGVLDGLLEIGADIRSVVGVSAGATNAVSFLSGQHGRNLAIMEKYLHNPHYIGWGNFRRCRAMMDLDFVFDMIPRVGIPFDYDAFAAFPGKLLVGVYNIETGQNEYHPHTELDGHSMLLRASCSIPLMFPFVQIGGRWYADGGLGDPIPYEASIRSGNRRSLIVLTQRRGYRKQRSWADALTAQRYRRRYPQLAHTVETRYLHYNEQLDDCQRLEQAGEALLLYPEVSFTVDRFEQDKEKLRQLYEDGRRQVTQRRDELLQFIEEGNRLA